MSRLPFAEHPQRLDLANEIHARPSAAIGAPALATHVAVLLGAEQRHAEFAHVERLCLHFGAPMPAPGLNHFSATLGELTFAWEAHGEFSRYTFVHGEFAPADAASAFGDGATRHLPRNWLATIPGEALVAAQCLVVARGELDAPALARHFGGHIVVGSRIGEAAAGAYTDFMVYPDGWSRFVLAAGELDARETGRIVQRLFEIETYRMMALLAFPIARGQSARLAEIENTLRDVIDGISAAAGDDEALLQDVTRLAARVEAERIASQFRYSASRAYGDLVATRIGELRERRIAGMQPIGEFMARRFDPALATCSTAARRLDSLSERVARTGSLLSTRVDIARERQNQALLASMDRRAKLQLRLQQTVEGLSIAAIVYYIAGLLGYAAKALTGWGVPIHADTVVGVSIPILVAVVAIAMRRARTRHAN